MKRSAVGGLTPNGSFDRLLASQWTRRRGPETMAITIDRGKVSVMPDELRPDLVYAMADAVDKMLLSWEPAPSLSEAISALVQSLARALSATTDPGPSLATVKDGVEHLLVKFCAPGAANQIDFELQSAPDIPQFMPFHSPRSIFRIEEQSHFHIGIRSSLSCSATWLLIVAGHFLSSGAATRMILSPFSSVLSTRFAHPRDHILAVRADPVFYNLPLRLPSPDLQ